MVFKRTILLIVTFQLGLVAQSDACPTGIQQEVAGSILQSVGCMSDWYSAGGRGFDPPVRQYSFLEIGHAIISAAIFSLSLIQVGQLSVTGERMCTKN